MAVTTDITELHKYTYGAQNISYLASEEIVLWNIISRREVDVGGRGQHIIPFQTANTGVFRGHSEGGALTTTRAQPSTGEMTFSLQEFHGIYDVSWKLLQDAGKSEWAFQRAQEFMENSMRRRTMRLLNAELLGYGKGELGILSAADDQTTVTMRALPLVDQGMVVDCVDLSDDDTKIGDSLTVSAINVQTREVTLSGALSGSAAGDYLTAEDSVSSSGGALHLIGLLAWIDTANPDSVVGNIGGVNRSTAGNEWAEANVLDNSGNGNRPLTEDLMIQGLDLVRERGGMVPTDVISNLAIIRRYHESLRGETIATMGGPGPVGGGLGRNESQMQRGAKGRGRTPYDFSNLQWAAEPFFDANRVVMINRNDWEIGHGENEVPQPIGEIFDVDLFKRTSNATFEVDHYWQAELLCNNIVGQLKIEEIAES